MMLADRYRLDALLGHGGMGEVWQAWDTRLSRPVAVKLLADAAVGDDALTEVAGASARVVSTDAVPHATNAISVAPLIATVLREEVADV